MERVTKVEEGHIVMDSKNITVDDETYVQVRNHVEFGDSLPDGVSIIKSIKGSKGALSLIVIQQD